MGFLNSIIRHLIPFRSITSNFISKLCKEGLLVAIKDMSIVLDESNKQYYKNIYVSPFEGVAQFFANNLEYFTLDINDEVLDWQSTNRLYHLQSTRNSDAPILTSNQVTFDIVNDKLVLQPCMEISGSYTVEWVGNLAPISNSTLLMDTANSRYLSYTDITGVNSKLTLTNFLGNTSVTVVAYEKIKMLLGEHIYHLVFNTTSIRLYTDGILISEVTVVLTGSICINEILQSLSLSFFKTLGYVGFFAEEFDIIKIGNRQAKLTQYKVGLAAPTASNIQVSNTTPSSNDRLDAVADTTITISYTYNPNDSGVENVAQRLTFWRVSADQGVTWLNSYGTYTQESYNIPAGYGGKGYVLKCQLMVFATTGNYTTGIFSETPIINIL